MFSGKCRSPSVFCCEADTHTAVPLSSPRQPTVLRSLTNASCSCTYWSVSCRIACNMLALRMAAFDAFGTQRCSRSAPIFLCGRARHSFDEKVAKWAGLKHSEEVVQRAITRSSFKSMRRKEEANGLLIFDQMFPQRDKSWRMTRKGKSGGWEECFISPASKDIFNEQAYSTMFNLGYVTDEHW